VYIYLLFPFCFQQKKNQKSLPIQPKILFWKNTFLVALPFFFMLTTFLYIQHLKKYRKTSNTYGRFEVSTGQTTKDFFYNKKMEELEGSFIF